MINSIAPKWYVSCMDDEKVPDGYICDGCGTPIFFYGESSIDCPQCGDTYINEEM